MGVMHQPVQDGIGERGVADGLVPMIDGQLAGDEGGSDAVTVVEDFQQVEVFEAGRLFQLGEAEPVGEAAAVAFGDLAVDEQPHALQEAEAADVRHLLLPLQRMGMPVILRARSWSKVGCVNMSCLRFSGSIRGRAGFRAAGGLRGGVSGVGH